jgi:peptidoglycan/xylan/chitin deacetylase (PgdA/CDA1 family)
MRGTAAFHAFVASSWLVWPSRWHWLVGALVLNHSLLVAAGLIPRSRWLGPNLDRLPPEMAARGEVGLTFDDGPDQDTTPAVLRILESRGAKATFFCVGSRVERLPDIASETARRGHRLENHSYRHSAAFFFHTPGELRRELASCNEIIERVAGRRPVWFRAPAGFRGPLLQPALEDTGLALASWTRRGFDAFERQPGRVVRRLTRNLCAGDVLLLHDGSSARTPTGRSVAIEALPALLDVVEKAGLRAFPLPERTVA